jgi:methyltransferase (TIGR00027 family)
MALIKDVSDTAFWVAYFRAKESARSDALFNDPFAGKLVGDHGRQIAESMNRTSSYVEWAVVSRTVIIDRFILKAVQEGVDAVINLGAGLDARPYRMNLPADLEWIEADYPNIIAHKRRLLASDTPRCKLGLVEVDLADDRKRREFLARVAPNARKVLVLTEGVIPYLSPEQVSELAADLLAQPRIAFWITEYFNPKVYRYLQMSAREQAMQNAPFRFYPADWYGFFRERGWSAKETRYSGEIAFEMKRRPPMPWWATLMFRFMPKQKKEEAMRMTGYMMFERAG